MGSLTQPAAPAPSPERLRRTRAVIMVGTFPPPVQGMAAMNAAVRGQLIERGVQPIVLDLSPASLDRRWFVRLLRVGRIVRRWGRFLRLVREHRRDSTVYLSLSGGWGQAWELPFVAIARLLQLRLILHHHSFAYVDRPRALTRTLLATAGRKAMHVALCKSMAKGLRSSYGSVRKVTLVSNAALLQLPSSQAASGKSEVRTIGFLGNICFEKGIAEFLEVAARLEASGSLITAVIAGPFQTPEVAAVVHQRLAQLKHCTYIGPQYGPAKDAFYERIDVLLFPSKYPNEAEPLTVYEAMRAGVAVLAWDRGCLAGMLSGGAGALIARGDDFVACAEAQLRAWRQAPHEFRKVSRTALEAWSAMNRNHAHSLALLVGALRGSRQETGEGILASGCEP